MSDNESLISVHGEMVTRRPGRASGAVGTDVGDAPSRWLRYLPGLYHDDPFIGDFLRIFESIWAPLDRQIDQVHRYFDPTLTPAEYLPWLASWVELALDENWPIARRRQLIRHAADLYLRRGTKRGLRDYLAIYAGVEPSIEESEEPFHFTVTFRLPDPATLDQDRVRRIIDEAKPAHATYALRVEPR